jgi:hypothetical protein
MSTCLIRFLCLSFLCWFHVHLFFFDSCHFTQDIRKLAHQLCYSYGVNFKVERPFQLHFTSFGGEFFITKNSSEKIQTSIAERKRENKKWREIEKEKERTRCNFEVLQDGWPNIWKLVMIGNTGVYIFFLDTPITTVIQKMNLNEWTCCFRCTFTQNLIFNCFPKTS